MAGDNLYEWTVLAVYMKCVSSIRFEGVDLGLIYRYIIGRGIN